MPAPHHPNKQQAFAVALPPLIEIVPPKGPLEAQLTVPGSKSITNRALVLAALAEGESVLHGALWSEDTQVMVGCLQDLGFMVNVGPDPAEPCNRTLTVYGKGGRVPPGGSPSQPLELFVGNAGTAARFLTALVCLGQGAYRVHGVERMHERPQAALFAALRTLGYRIESPNERLPATVLGGGPRPGACRVSIEESSQFASALLLCARRGGWRVELIGHNAEESPYVTLTEKLLAGFPASGGMLRIEPDASSGSYFWAAARLLAPRVEPGKETAGPRSRRAPENIGVAHWPRSGWQIDERFPELVQARPVRDLDGRPRVVFERRSISRQTDLGDSILTAMVMAPFAAEPVRFTELGRLRLQECERVAAIRTELTKCGVTVIEEGDTLTISPSEVRGAELQSYDDHRMAMCFATLGLALPGIRIRNPGCVKKTFPNFFQKLAARPPHGLGVTIFDASARRAIALEDLFAD
jgi:3-phosphoshikimate 1-carboxyvinyltransferase